jgi:hypothetical protein
MLKDIGPKHRPENEDEAPKKMRVVTALFEWSLPFVSK